MKTKLILKSDKGFSFFLALIVLSLFVINLSSGLQELIGVPSSTISTVCKVFLGVAFIILIPELIAEMTIQILMAIYMTILVICIQLLFFPSLDVFFLKTMVTFCTGCLTSLVVGASISDLKFLKRTLENMSHFIAVIVWIFTILTFSGKITQTFRESYSMGFGYSLVVPTLCLINEKTKTPFEKITNRVGILGLLVAIISFGSRGPLLGIGLYILYYELRKSVETKDYTKLVIWAATIILFLLFYKKILLYLYNVLSEYGINSRTLLLMTRDDIYLSKRDILWKKILDIWEKNPFAIRGINAEWKVVGLYAHNIIYELLFQFGIIIGGIILALITRLVFRQLIYPKKTIGNELCVILLFSSVPELFFSNSVWESYIFWMWIGLSLGNKCKDYRGE